MGESTTPVVERTTHRHLLAALLTEARARFPEGVTVRVLDAGCGNGHLIADLHRALAALDPAHAALYRANLVRFEADLAALETRRVP